MVRLPVLSSRAPNQHYRSFLFLLRARLLEPLQIFPRHHKRRRQVNGDRRVPLLECHLRYGYIFSLPISVIDDDDLNGLPKRGCRVSECLLDLEFDLQVRLDAVKTTFK